jgi:hypothetical protein
MRLLEIAVTRHTLKLTPEFATGMPIGTYVATSEPAEIRAVLVGAELLLGVNGALAAVPRGEPAAAGHRATWEGYRPPAHKPHTVVYR